MPYKPSGVTPDSGFNMVLGPGAFYFGIDTSLITPTTTAEEFGVILQTALEGGKCIGVTEGDGTFSLVPTFREITMAGVTSPVVGSQVLQRWDVFLAGTAKEMTLLNLKRLLVTPRIVTATGALTVSNTLLPCHYIPHFSWAGMYNDGDLLYIDLENVLNTAGFVAGLPAEGEMTAPFEFHAFQADLANMQNVPVNIWQFEWATPIDDECESLEP